MSTSYKVKIGGEPGCLAENDSFYPKMFRSVWPPPVGTWLGPCALPRLRPFLRRRIRKRRLRHMAQGTVKWLSQEKGYGFINPDDGSEDIFVHYSAVKGSGFRSLEEGEQVSYEVTQGRKGLQAENVSRA
jgi:CspA family cold shock protein